MIENDLDNYMKQDWVMTCSDGGSSSHPRTYGTFLRKIKEYVLERQLLSMASAIHKATGQTATFFGLDKRGFIREGYYADIVLFDPKTLKDNATYDAPASKASGIKYVFVNGVPALKDEKFTGILAGAALRHQPE